uniref:G-protein coupled receptors family 1 profile domain-containing protein n=1 Tax=Megaselia scalaris TaxID=36166 RepID=T1GZF1_MEGSC
MKDLLELTSIQYTDKVFTTLRTPLTSHIAQNYSSGSSRDESNKYDPILDVGTIQIFFCVLYATVFVLGVFGNALVCYVVLRNRAMQTVTNIFITNLALSDILLCLLAVPFTPMYTFIGRWAFGKTLCHFMPYRRYFVIIYPFKPRMKLSTCITIIIAIWLVALLATLPYGLYMKILTLPMEEATTKVRNE